MGNQKSFVSFEKKISPKMRVIINNSEDKVDLANGFSVTMANFLNEVFDNQFNVKVEDVVFDPNNDEFYTMKDRLLENDSFKEVWDSSDLSNVIKKFAHAVHNKYIHLDKHPEKTNKKIRN